MFISVIFKDRFSRFLLLLNLLLISAPILSEDVYRPATDPMIAFYLNKVDSVFNNYYIFNRPEESVFKVRCIYLVTNYRGKSEVRDTAVYGMNCRDGKFDLNRIIDSSSIKDNPPPTAPIIEKPWEGDFQFYIFPNDTGAGDLAIGFVFPYGEKGDKPTGLFTLDRESYNIKSLVLSYIQRTGFESYSESYAFYQADTLIRLKSLEINSSRAGFIGAKYVKHRFEFYDYGIR